jgi:sulfite reductase (NADPH) flavoprotein alpha-component
MIFIFTQFHCDVNYQCHHFQIPWRFCAAKASRHYLRMILVCDTIAAFTTPAMPSDALHGCAIESRFMTTSYPEPAPAARQRDAAPEARQQRQAAAASPRRHWSWKQVWFQLHWFIGITAGTVLVVIGLSGATLAFKDELLDLMNPGVRHVPVETHAPLTPGQLSSIAAAEHGQRVASITMYAEAGAAPRLFFAPKQGQRRGASIYVHPYTGATQPALAGAGFFEWTESLHRWLLLPRRGGRWRAPWPCACWAGTFRPVPALAAPSAGLAHVADLRSGPERPLFLWNLHAVAGTVPGGVRGADPDGHLLEL